jgi:hypothetical protein
MPHFRLLKALESPEGGPRAGHTGTVGERSLRWFPGDGLAPRFARALARRRAVPMKELVEAFEFFAAVRKDLRATRLADLCAGHGLVGALFALHERRLERVHLVDRRTPPSRAAVLEAAAEVGPWTREKLVSHEERLEAMPGRLPAGTAVVAVHACGLRTDRCLDLALELAGPVALMPCCHSHRRCASSPALAGALGHELAIDVERTYRMEASGLRVRWTEIPVEITPRNRVLVGRPAARPTEADLNRPAPPPPPECAPPGAAP